MKTLIVEDERKVGEFIECALTEQGYATRLVGTCADAQNVIAGGDIDTVILDLGLPDGDGLDLLRNWRASGVTVPVLILSARDAITDRIRGLDIGADDYLPKPFSLEELLARVRSLLRRRAASGSQQQTVFEHAGIRMDLLARAVTFEGREVDLTNREFALLELFLHNIGRQVARTLIAEKVWHTSLDLETNLIDVYIRRLRKKFERSAGGNTAMHALIKTVRGTGYQMG